MLLEWKSHNIIKQIDIEKANSHKLKTVFEYAQGEVSWKEHLLRSLVRPFVLFIQEPIIQLFGVYLAFVYGILYCMFFCAVSIDIKIVTRPAVVFATLPRICTEFYHQRIGIFGLLYSTGKPYYLSVYNIDMLELIRCFPRTWAYVGRPNQIAYHRPRLPNTRS